MDPRKINITRVFRSCWNLQFQELLKTQVILILNFIRPHAITDTKRKRAW